MRFLVFMLVWSTVVVVAGCTQTEALRASRSLVEAKPAPAPEASPSPYRSDQAKGITPYWPNHFTFVEHSIPSRDLEEDGYKLKAQYPQISSKAREAHRFNRWIKNKVLGHANEFRRLADAEQRRKHKERPVLWALDLRYVVYYSSERLVSLRLTHIVMEAGQTHPIAYYETINFDLKKGTALRAKDIFKRGYLKSFSTWNIVPDGMLLSFEDYQVEPHSFGQPEFVVPFSAMRDTIRQNVLRALAVSQ